MSLSHTSREDIVITGMACRFAESPNLAAFWRNVMQRKALFSFMNGTAASGTTAMPRKIHALPPAVRKRPRSVHRAPSTLPGRVPVGQ